MKFPPLSNRHCLRVCNLWRERCVAQDKIGAVKNISPARPGLAGLAWSLPTLPLRSPIGCATSPATALGLAWAWDRRSDDGTWDMRSPLSQGSRGPIDRLRTARPRPRWTTHQHSVPHTGGRHPGFSHAIIYLSRKVSPPSASTVHTSTAPASSIKLSIREDFARDVPPLAHAICDCDPLSTPPSPAPALTMDAPAVPMIPRRDTTMSMMSNKTIPSHAELKPYNHAVAGQ